MPSSHPNTPPPVVLWLCPWGEGPWLLTPCGLPPSAAWSCRAPTRCLCPFLCCLSLRCRPSAPRGLTGQLFAWTMTTHLSSLWRRPGATGLMRGVALLAALALTLTLRRQARYAATLDGLRWTTHASCWRNPSPILSRSCPEPARCTLALCSLSPVTELMSFSPEAPRPTAANVDQGACVKKKVGLDCDVSPPFRVLVLAQQSSTKKC